MKNITKKLITVEHHCLDLQYAHLRFHKSSTRESLSISIEQNGQLMPVIIIPGVDQRWILIDGHLRLQVLKRLGKDTVEAEIWRCDATDALLNVIKSRTGRPLEVFEEALILKELHTKHALTHDALSKRIGRDRSWVSRRLSLIEFLPDDTLSCLSRGEISLWVVSRVLAPVARATANHAQIFLNYLCKNSHSTREIETFYKHYQRSNLQERFNMVNDPALFFKAKKIIDADKHADTLRDGPEGKWKNKLRLVAVLLSELIILEQTIFYVNQKPEDARPLMNDFNIVKIKFKALIRKVEGLVDA